MTNYEYITRSTQALAEHLCDISSQSKGGCTDCPAECHYGHNGMQDWLECERKEDEV